MQTVADFIRARAEDEHSALFHREQRWSYREFVGECAQRAAWLLSKRKPGPFHVGILLDNRPEFAFWIGACALAGATMVGINSTRRGDDLARDIEHSACQLLVTETRWRSALDAVSARCPELATLEIDSAEAAASLAPFAAAALPQVEVSPRDVFMLIFTSGSSGAPKACICSHGRIAALAHSIAQHCGHGPDSVSLVTMPWFHAGAINTGWLPALSAGAATVIDRFSVSGFMPAVRRYQVTHFNYVGKPLAYLLTAAEQADDADNSLRMVLGNEGAIDDIERFAERYACMVVDGYGSTEGGISISRRPGMPRGCLGMPNHDGVAVYDPVSGKECPRARLNASGELLNSNEAIGELVNIHGAAGFEGYWNNPAANEKRVRGGIFWSGDLAYRDEEGHFWFAGRDDDWLRVDGENIASAQIEERLFRHPDVVLAAAYAVPDPQVGDRVMLALQLREGKSFDVDDFVRFLLAQPDFSHKWRPSFIRITTEMPMTATAKVLRRQLREQRWHSADELWWHNEHRLCWERFDAAARAAWEARFSPATLQRL
ncbi:MAG: AMP-binding protein [Thauera sp.]|jgi:fatty-acyl-CoA synthase|nr:AMP-binding protein [Thauera sp.]